MPSPNTISAATSTGGGVVLASSILLAAGAGAVSTHKAAHRLFSIAVNSGGGHRGYDLEEAPAAYPVIGLLMCVSVALTFYGYRWFKFTSFVSGFFLFFILTYAALYSTLGVETDTDSFIAIGSASVAGLLGATLSCCSLRVGTLAVGAAFGAAAGMVLTPLGLYKISPNNSGEVLAGACAVLALLGLLVSAWLKQRFVIAASAASGAAVTVRCVAFFAGEWTTLDEFEGQDAVSWEQWAYLAAVLALAVIGAAFQTLAMTGRSTDEEHGTGQYSSSREIQCCGSSSRAKQDSGGQLYYRYAD